MAVPSYVRTSQGPKGMHGRGVELCDVGYAKGRALTA